MKTQGVKVINSVPRIKHYNIVTKWTCNCQTKLAISKAKMSRKLQLQNQQMLTCRILKFLIQLY